MPEDPPPYGKKKFELCPLFCGTPPRDVRCHLEHCLWWKDGLCTIRGVVTAIMEMRERDLPHQ